MQAEKTASSFKEVKFEFTREYSSETSIMGKSSRLILAIVLVGARLFSLRMLVFLLTLPCESRVGAVTLTFSGFQENSLHLVSNSSWISNTTTGCFKFDPRAIVPKSIASGRLLYPFAVQMIDPGSTTVKSWSTTFIYQFQIVSEYGYNNGPGMAFSIVPDNLTLGATGDYMGLVTEETPVTAKNYESDDRTLGVELDLFRNRGFNDTNNNHIGINLASMNSTYSFKPVYSLASSSASLHQQIWIDYDAANSRMDIYYANYKEGRPAEPQGSRSGLDLSLLKENMYIGFSSANKIGSGFVPYVCAWSFSNDGNPAPSIVLAQDATPGAPPPPPSMSPPSTISRTLGIFNIILRFWFTTCITLIIMNFGTT